MSEKANQFRIGVFVVVGVAIVLAALFAFGIRTAFEPTHKFETYVLGEVNGLSLGSVVKLRGVEVGKVTEIGFSWILYDTLKPPRCVVVRFEVKEHFSPFGSRAELDKQLVNIVNDGMRAVVQPEGITGTSILALLNVDAKKYPPLVVPWTPRYGYIPSAPSEFGQILASLNQTLSNLEKLDVERLVESLDRTLVSADTALKRLSELDVKGISDGVNAVVADAGTAIEEIRALLEDARGTLNGMRLEKFGQDADTLINNLDARLSRLIDKLSGVDVRALNDTLAGTRDAARNLNDALEDLKKYPSGFLLGGPPPPAAGLEKEKKP
jgi:ABC-type transporter Mla subunit MlaD